jgi:hypothetical protein
MWSRSEDQKASSLTLGCIVIALLGKIKGKHHERCHLLPSVPVTQQSGVRVAESLERLIASKRRNGFEDGPAISYEKGEAYSSRL